MNEAAEEDDWCGYMLDAHFIQEKCIDDIIDIAKKDLEIEKAGKR